MRGRAILALRAGFVLLTVALAWWGFRGRWDEIGAALGRTGPLALLAAIACTCGGLLLTAILWRHLLARLGSPVPLQPAAAIFLLGQLGKYIPGSVWTFAAQAELGRAHRIPARSSVAASAVFLLLHTLTGVLLGSVVAMLGGLGPDWAHRWWPVAALGSAALLAPPVLRWVSVRLAGPDATVAVGIRDVGHAVVVMAGVWVAYGLAVQVLIDGARPDDLVLVIGAFALSHAAGVLLVLAPAGLGAREGVLIVLLGPVVGFGPAAAAALLARVAHTLGDFLCAAIAGAAARMPRRNEAARVG